MGGEGNGVAAAQAEKAQNGQQPAGSGLTLAHVPLPQQLHGLLHMEPAQIQKQRHKQQRAEKDRRDGDAVDGDEKFILHVDAQHSGHQHGDEPLQQHPQQDAAAGADEPGVQGLKAEDKADVSLAHAQNVVQRQLLAPALHEEAVGIDQENDEEQAQHEGADGHEHAQVEIALQLRQGAGLGQGQIDVEGGGADDHRQQVGEVELAVFDAVLGGKPGIKGFTHCGRLSAGGSGCRRSCRTSRPRSCWPGTAGGTPRRP